MVSVSDRVCVRVCVYILEWVVSTGVFDKLAFSNTQDRTICERHAWSACVFRVRDRLVIIIESYIRVYDGAECNRTFNVNEVTTICIHQIDKTCRANLNIRLWLSVAICIQHITGCNVAPSHGWFSMLLWMEVARSQQMHQTVLSSVLVGLILI